MTRLQGSLHATARALAPSEEAFDTPLSPPPLSDEPGPATGRSGAYPNGTLTRKPGPACRTQDACHHELAACYRINPAKGINVLADEGLLEQRRRRLAKRYIEPMAAEASRLGHVQEGLTI